MLIAAHVRQQPTYSAINFLWWWMKGVADKLCVLSLYKDYLSYEKTHALTMTHAKHQRIYDHSLWGCMNIWILPRSRPKADWRLPTVGLLFVRLSLWGKSSYGGDKEGWQQLWRDVCDIKTVYNNQLLREPPVRTEPCRLQMAAVAQCSAPGGRAAALSRLPYLKWGLDSLFSFFRTFFLYK